MIAVNYQFEIPIPSSGGFLGDFSASWYFDVGSVQQRLQSLGYNAAVTRDFSYPRIFVNIRGIPDYFANAFGGNQQYYYEQAKLDAETSANMAASGQLQTTQWATPATYVQNQVGQNLPDLSGLFPSGAAAGSVLGTATPIIFLGAVLLLIIAIKK